MYISLSQRKTRQSEKKCGKKKSENTSGGSESTQDLKIPENFPQAESWAQYGSMGWLRFQLGLMELWSGQALGSELSSFSPGFSYQQQQISSQIPQGPIPERGNNDSVCLW